MPKSRKVGKVRVPIGFPPDLHERLVRAAKADERTVTGFVVRAVRRAVEEFEAAHPPVKK